MTKLLLFGRASQDTDDRPTNRFVPWIVLLFVVMTLTIGLTRCKTAWFDETAYSAPAIDWYARGRLTFANYPGVAAAEFTPFVVHPLLLGTFFRLFGVGLLQSRLFVLTCYLLLLMVAYKLFRVTGFPSFAAWLGVLSLAIDPAIVWQVRSGRPDLVPILLTAIAALGFSRSLSNSGASHGRLWAFAAGAFAALAPLAHPYAVPGVSVVGLTWLSVLWARVDRRTAGVMTLTAAAGSVAAAVIVACCFYPAIGEMVAGLKNQKAFLAENRAAGVGISQRFLKEITQRWCRGTFIEPIRWLIILLGLPVALRLQRTLTSACIAWLACLFIGLALWIPHGTWYQTAYGALPLAGLVAATTYAMIEHGRARRLILGLWGLSFASGYAILVPYPVAAIMQWEARSHDLLVAKLAALIPPGSTVACDPSAYFAAFENDCHAYYGDLFLRGLHRDPKLNAAYQESLVSRFGVRYFVVAKGYRPGVLKDAVLIGTTGMTKSRILIAADANYDFDVYQLPEPQRAASQLP